MSRRLDCPTCGEGLGCVICGADVLSSQFVPCDAAAVERGARAVSGGLVPTGKERRLAEAVLRAAGEAP